MANLTQVLYGNRLYGRVTYQENNDPQTFNASLSDSQSSAESDLFKIQKPLSDSQASVDALTKLVKMLLAETQGSTEARIASVLKALAETQGSSDIVHLAGGKALGDILSLAETISRLVKKVLADTQATADAKTFALMRIFGETETSTDSLSIGTNKAIAEIVALSDSSSKIAGKTFNEITTSSPNLYARTLFGAHTYSSDFIDRAIYMRDAVAKKIGKLLAESIGISDGAVVIHQTKGLLDFMVLQEWFGIKIARPTIWSATSGTALSPSVQTLYAKTLFGQKQFAATPIVEWGKSAANTSVWGNSAVQTPSVQSLYAKILFGQSLFSDKPVIAWVKPTTTVTENWTNLDGQNNQEA